MSLICKKNDICSCLPWYQPFCCRSINGRALMKRIHNYYYQIEYQLASCHGVWTPHDTSIERTDCDTWYSSIITSHTHRIPHIETQFFACHMPGFSVELVIYMQWEKPFTRYETCQKHKTCHRHELCRHNHTQSH